MFSSLENVSCCVVFLQPVCHFVAVLWFIICEDIDTRNWPTGRTPFLFDVHWVLDVLYALNLWPCSFQLHGSTCCLFNKKTKQTHRSGKFLFFFFGWCIILKNFLFLVHVLFIFSWHNKCSYLTLSREWRHEHTIPQ